MYWAVDSVLERPVAVKLLSDRQLNESDARTRFRREALAAARVPSHHVVTVFDVGEHEGRPLIVMEYVEGGSLDEAMRRGKIPREQALTWLAQAGDALDRAHAEGVVHRDVKPANLLLDREGNVRVSDFGIASTAGSETITLPGTILGTVGYLAPEQARGEPASPASDRYSLAVVAFELLTGHRPFQSETATTEILAHLHADVPRASAVSSHDLPPAVDAVFGRALAKDPRDRPPSCAELVGDLRDALAVAPTPVGDGEPTGVAGVDAPTRRLAVEPARQRRTIEARAPRWRAGSKGLVLVVAIGTAIVGLAVLGSSYEGGGGPPASPAPPPQTTVARRAPSGAALNEIGYTRIRAGHFSSALLPLRRAVLALGGSGSLTEAYADYNLAFARFALGRCDGVLGLLARSESIQGRRTEIDALRARWQAACAPTPVVVGTPGEGRGNGHRRGRGNGNGGREGD